jgi:hypothetical protein
MRPRWVEFTIPTMWNAPMRKSSRSPWTTGPLGAPRSQSTSTKGVTLFKFRLVALTAFVAVAAVVASSALATSTKIVPFTATYAGTANVTVADSLATISATGAGTGTAGVGKVTGAGTGTADSSATCQVWKGTGVITGKKGNINFTIASGQACGDEAGDTFSLTGRATVTKGTKIFKGAKGSLKLTGVYKKSAKTFSVKFNGKLTV